MTLSSTMLKEMAFRLYTGLRRNVEIHIKKHYDNNGSSSSNGSSNGGRWVGGNSNDGSNTITPRTNKIMAKMERMLG